MIMEAGKSRLFRVRGGLDSRSRVDAAVWVQRQSVGGILSYAEISFFSSKAFNPLKGPTHIMEANLFYSTSTDLNLNLI